MSRRLYCLITTYVDYTHDRVNKKHLARFSIVQFSLVYIACENIRFSSLFASGDARNVPGGEERGETDVFAGYLV